MSDREVKFMLGEEEFAELVSKTERHNAEDGNCLSASEYVAYMTRLMLSEWMQSSED